MTDEELRQAIIDVLTEVGGDVTEVPDATSTELNTPAAVTMPLYVAGNYKKTTLQAIITKATENIDPDVIEDAVEDVFGITMEEGTLNDL